MGFNIADLFERAVDAVPTRKALVCGDRTLTFTELDDEANQLANHLLAEGFGHGDHIGIYGQNSAEWMIAMVAIFKIRAVPININFRYVEDELVYLFDNADLVALIHDREYIDRIEAVTAKVPGLRHFVMIDDETDLDPSRIGSVPWSDAIAGASPDRPQLPRSDDDHYVIYTGGTTGMPKGVMWRSDDLYVALWQMARPGTEPVDPVAAVTAGKRAATALPACPLMHGTGLFIALSTLAGGGTVVLVDSMRLEPERIWTEVETNAAGVLTIVGDVFARPLLDALDAEPLRWDLSALRAITSSGVTWSPDVKRGLLDHLPTITLLDSLGASEGMITRSATKAGDAEIASARFAVNERFRVLREADSSEVTPGSGEVGLVAVGGRIPLGYYQDPEKTAKTFRLVDGTRYSIPGDYATVEGDGTIRLLGRGSATVNTGGEKVYPEEIELLLKKNGAVYDCVIVGVPDPRFGERVVALVQVTDGYYTDEEELRAVCRSRGLAGYKIPKRFVFVDSLNRAANGKADYTLLKEMAADLLEIQTGGATGSSS